jgi:2-dehydropantoate 2-reductase
MIDRRPDRARLVASRGIMVTGISGDFTAPVEATTDTGTAREANLIVICVKSYDTANAVAALPPDLPADCAVLTLQNGLGNVELIAERFGAERAYAGTTALGATLIGPGHARHSGTGVTVVGRYKGVPDDNVARIVGALNGAGLEARATEDVTIALWNKVIVNAAINALTALTGVRNGRLMELPEAHRLLVQVVRECAEVARTKGIADDPLPRVEEICVRTAQNVSSMLQDVLKARKTEISSINGAILKEAVSHGIPAPVNAALTSLVSALEKSRPFWLERRKAQYGVE